MMLGRPLARVGAVFAFCCCLAACGGDSPATAPAAQAGSHGIDAPAEPVAGASVGRAADAGPGSGFVGSATAPAGSSSAQVRIFVEQLSGSDAHSARFDQVVFHNASSVPVTLMQFDVE